MDTGKRKEIKFVIDRFDIIYLLNRFNATASLDKNCNGLDGYNVTSLYFDTVTDTSYLDKLHGIVPRDKYRLRYYEDSKQRIALEHKTTDERYKYKQSVILTRQEASEILRGNVGILSTETGVKYNFYIDYNSLGLRPRIVTRYNRIAWVYKGANTRVTIDRDIAVSNDIGSFLSDTIKTKPLPREHNILEIKYTNFIPSILLGILRFKRNLYQDAFSKYEAGRSIGDTYEYRY